MPIDCDPCGDGKVGNDCSNCDGEVEDDLDFIDDNYFDNLDNCGGIGKPYAHWVNSIGYAAINRVTFQIGGQAVDTLYGYFMEMWSELAYRPGLRTDELVGKRMTRQQLVDDSGRNRRLYVPLPFWFCRQSGNALPMASLQFHQVQLTVAFENLASLIQISDPDVTVVNCNTGAPVQPGDIRASLHLTHVYLDMQERDAFSTGAFQQLITQHQTYSTTSQTQ